MGGSLFDSVLISVLICPKCGGSIEQDNTEVIYCSQCTQKYTIENGIPVLLKNPHESFLEMDRRKESRPSWYISNQLDAIDRGPYRHHIRKRVEYILGIINNYKSQKIF